VVGPVFLLPLGVAAMNDSDVVIDTHAHTRALTHTHTENKIQDAVVI
jgi:hypothetical protein